MDQGTEPSWAVAAFTLCFRLAWLGGPPDVLRSTPWFNSR
jgi:hypothetical protein